MRNFHKFLATAIAGVMLVAAMCFGASAAKFTDVNAKDKVLSEAVDLLEYLNVTKGTTETTFGTNENVTRQQMAAFIYRLMKKGASLEGGENSTTFKDLEDSTYFAYISWANAMGIIKGRSDTVFDPKGTINLQEAYTMVIRALGYDDTEFMFPVDYNDLAEKEDVELDKGLPSGFSYETPLTRGAVAIILYNAFFAETGHEEVSYIERDLTDGSVVLVEKIHNPSLAEHVYDVEQGDFRVVATPRNAFNSSQGSFDYKPLYDEFDDVDMLQFVAVESGEVIDSFYYDFAKLGLDGKADDYIMGEFEVFYTVDEKDGGIDKIYYAGNSMNHVSTTDVKMTKMSPDKTKAEHYYEHYFGNSGKDYVLHKPYLSVAGNDIYLFDAPYSYAKPNYGTVTSDAGQYYLKNEKNAKLIGVELLDEEEGTYSYYIKDSFGRGAYKKFIDTFHQVATGGLVKCDIYDANGDGLYDYIRYRPYMFGKMDGDESSVFSAVAEHASNAAVMETNKDSAANKIAKIPTIYYNEAKLTGAKFNDGDFVIAALDVDSNEIDVLKVVDKVQGYVSAVNKANVRFTLNGKTYSCLSPGKLLENFNIGTVTDHDNNASVPSYKYTDNLYYHAHLYSAQALDNEYIIYVYGNSVLFYEPITEAGAVYNKDSLIIPLEAGQHDENTPGYFKGEFNPTVADEIFYIKAWVDGDVKFVPVSIEEMYPTPAKWGSERIFNDVGVLGKICNYTVDSDGIYHLTSLLYAKDEDGKDISINRDATVLKEEDNTDYFANDLAGEEVRIKKVVSDRFRLFDATQSDEPSLLGSDTDGTVDYMLLTDSTYIIIRNEKANVSSTKFEDKYEYLEFDINTFINSVAVSTDGSGADRYLENVQYILRADPDNDDRAYLEFLYAEMYDFDFITKRAEQNERVLLNSYPDADEDGYYRNYYDIYDPYTGKKLERVAGTKKFAEAKNLTATFANVNGKIARINPEGEIDETYLVGDEIKLAGNHHLAFIEDFTDDDNVLEITPVNSADAAAGGYYDAGIYYEVADDTPVMLIKYAKNSSSLYDAEISNLTVADLGSDKKDLRCYNDKIPTYFPGTTTVDTSKAYKTVYAEKLKCYFVYEDAKKPDEHPQVKFVFIVAHDNEAQAYLDLPDNYGV